VPFSIQPAGPEDVAGLAEVQVRSWQRAYRGQMPAAYLDSLSVARRTEAWIRTLREAGVTTLLARDPEGRVIAFINCGPYRDADLDPSHVMEIRALYVHPDHWRQGLGRALVDAAIARCAGPGVERVVLWVLRTNASAKAFYRAMGFFPDGGVKSDTRIGSRVLEEERFARCLQGAADRPGSVAP